MNLRDVFSNVAYKKLIAVDLPHGSSHQHELDGVRALRNFFNTSVKIDGAIQWFFFKDDEEPVRFDGTFTFYDSRERNPNRSAEWRMYYSGEILENAEPEDVVVLARKDDLSQPIFGLVFKNGSSWLRTAKVLFEIDNFGNSFQFLDENELNNEIEYSKQQLLDSLGIEYQIPISQTFEQIAIDELNRNDQHIPSTYRLAQLSWELSDLSSARIVDDILLIWLQNESELFFAMERIVVQPRIDRGFSTVEDFIQYSLQVQNRRKSRRGTSLQNHLERLFRENHLLFSAQAHTEGRNQPDFIFPGEREYHNPEFDSSLLVMLGAKSSCKERWAQVLNEADKIPNKHLCTLEQQLSETQTNQMRSRGLTLVVPEPYHNTFSETQRSEIWTLNHFVEFIHSKQNN